MQNPLTPRRPHSAPLRDRPTVLLSLGILLLVGCGAGSSAVRPTEGETFDVVLHRPAKAGDRARVEIIVVEEGQQSVQPQGNVAQGRIRAELHGLLEVVEVDASGMPSRRKMMVEKLTIETEGQTADVLPEGTVVHIARPTAEDESPYSVENVEIDPEAAESLVNVLSLVLPVQDEGQTYDQHFGTSERQPIGASWPVPAAFAESMNDEEKEVRASDFRGTTTLKGRSEVDGVPCLDIGIELELPWVVPKGLPETATINKGALSISIERSYPLDASKPALREKTVSNYELSITQLGRSGESTTAMQQQRTFEIKRQPL